MEGVPSWLDLPCPHTGGQTARPTSPASPGMWPTSVRRPGSRDPSRRSSRRTRSLIRRLPQQEDVPGASGLALPHDAALDARPRLQSSEPDELTRVAQYWERPGSHRAATAPLGRAMLPGWRGSRRAETPLNASARREPRRSRNHESLSCGTCPAAKRGMEGAKRGEPAKPVSDPADRPNVLEMNTLGDTRRDVAEVVRGGVEPPTLGFSVRCSTN